jgi:hypothetical protein
VSPQASSTFGSAAFARHGQHCQAAALLQICLP